MNILAITVEDFYMGIEALRQISNSIGHSLDHQWGPEVNNGEFELEQRLLLHHKYDMDVYQFNEDRKEGLEGYLDQIQEHWAANKIKFGTFGWFPVNGKFTFFVAAEDPERTVLKNAREADFRPIKFDGIVKEMIAPAWMLKKYAA